MRRDWFLIGLLAGIGGLIVIALLLFFLRPANSSYADDTTTAGVVKNYALAIQKRDFDRAYRYLADGVHRPTALEFNQTLMSYQWGEISNTPIEIGDIIIDEQGSTALVPITLVHGGQNFLDSIYRENQSAQLIKQGGSWKILSFPYPYWNYSWSIEITPQVQPTSTTTVQ
jgi:hypothetical protein